MVDILRCGAEHKLTEIKQKMLLSILIIYDVGCLVRIAWVESRMVDFGEF
jgi:hypothetical protein